MGLLDSIYSVYKKSVPLHLRTFGETILGNKNPITKENFSNKDLSDLSNSIQEARAFRQGLLDYKQLNPDVVNNKGFMQEYNTYFKNPKSEEYFLSGSGTVGYNDINRSHIIKEGRPIGGTGETRYDLYELENEEFLRSDWNPTQEAAIYNTLGRFPYKINPDGTVSIQEVYDFNNDPNALGRTVMGTGKRNVNINYMPEKRIMPNAKTRQATLNKIIEEIERNQNKAFQNPFED